MAGRSKSVAAAWMAAVTLLLFAPAADAQMGKKAAMRRRQPKPSQEQMRRPTRQLSIAFRRQRSRMILGARSTTPSQR